MVRKGNEPALAPDQHEAPETAADSRWLNGINRQLRPDAASHQLAASTAAATKRKAEAMPKTERNAKRAAHAREVRAAAKRQRIQAAATERAAQKVRHFYAALERVAEDSSLGEAEQLDFSEWLLLKELEPDLENLEEWRGSDSYERSKRERIFEGCTCFLSPNGGKRVTSLPYEELKRRRDDNMLQAGESFEAWDERVLADRQARRVSIGEYFERPWAFAWCGSFRKCTCTYDGHSDEARVMPDVPGQNCDDYDERQLEPQTGDWQPSGGDYEGWDGTEEAVADAPPLPQLPPPPPPPPPPQSVTYEEFLDRHRCKGCGFFRCQCIEPTAPATTATQPVVDESDAYELDQERALEEQGRISAIHCRPWHEVASGATVPMHWLDYIDRPSERLTAASRPPMQRPLSPAPEASDFETEEEYLQERARWFREHGDGSELQGESRREQNDTFQRLKDRLFGLRRARANPSGTPRALQRSGPASSSTEPPAAPEKSWEQMQSEAYAGEGEFSADMFY